MLAPCAYKLPNTLEGIFK